MADWNAERGMRNAESLASVDGVVTSATDLASTDTTSDLPSQSDPAEATGQIQSASAIRNPQSAFIYTVGGAVQASQGVYIPRQADEDLLALCRANVFAYVLSPRQLGKSSLMIHTAERLAAEGTRTVLLDLTAIGTQVGADDWYFGLLYEIADQLGLATDVYEWWQTRAALGPTQRFTLFFREVVLEEVDVPLVIFVDEIDTTLSLPFADDFFAAIRACFDARARVAAFRRLSFVLIGVATPGDLVHDPKRTPFNIGQRVEMTDFSAEEARPLAAGLGLPPADARQVLGWVLGWTGGHPYLTQRLCQAITQDGRTGWTESALAALVRRLFFGEESSQDNNVQFVRDMLTKRAPDPVGVLQVYREVRRGRHPVHDEEQSVVKSHLKLAGVVRREKDLLRVRNPIYRTVFDDRWIKAHLPSAINWVNWLRRAMIAILVLFVVSVTALGLYAEARRQEAEQARTLAEARELAIRAQTAPDPEVGLLLALAAGNDLQAGHVPDANGQIVRVLSAAIANSHVRARFTQPGAVTGVAWSPDGRRMVTAGADGIARIWDAAVPVTGAGAGTPALLLRGHTDALNSVAWSPDGRSIVTASRDGTAKVWDAATGQERLTLKGHADAVLDAAWSPDSRLIVTASRDNTAKVWDATTGQQRLTLAGHTGWVRAVAWSPDGKEIVTASADTTAKVWDAQTGQERLTLQGHIRDVHDAAWSPDGKQIVTASEDRTALVWDAQTGRQVLTLKGHLGVVNAAAWSPDGKQIVTASDDGTAKIWDATTGQDQLTLRGHTAEVNAAAWSPDGRTILTAGADATARLWAPGAAPERLVLQGPAQGVLAVAGSPDGRFILAGGADNTTRIWDAQSGQALATLRGHSGAVRAVAWRPDGKQIATASADGTVKIWDAATDQEVRTLQGHTAGVNGVAWTAGGATLVTASDDGTAGVWNAADGQERLVLHGPTRGVLSAAAAPNGLLIALAGQDTAAQLWDSGGQAGQPRQTLAGHTDVIHTVAWSPDGKQLATASDDGTARVWDAATGQEQTTFKGHGDAVLSVAWSPDGQTLVSAGADGAARVWDAAGGQERLSFPGPAGTLNAATWSADGRFVLTAGADGAVRVYAANLPDLLALAATRVTRALAPQEAEAFGLLPTPTAPAPTATPVVVAAQPTATAVPLPPTRPPSPSPTAIPALAPLPIPPGSIAFASNRGAPPESHVYVMKTDGTDQRVLTSAPFENLYPDWSPDGTRLVYMAASPKVVADSPGGDLFIMNADGTGRTQLTRGLNAKWPRWSPDGAAILYADAPENRSPSYDLYLITLADHAIRRLTDSPGFDGFPAWTPTGRIVFTSARVDNKTHLFTMNADGSGQQQLTFATGEQENASVAPDGSRIAFVSTQNGGEHIYTMNSDGSNLRQITFGAGVDRYPSWSPDGRWIAFHSNRDDQHNFEIYVVSAAGGEVRRLTTTGGDDDEPAWQP